MLGGAGTGLAIGGSGAGFFATFGPPFGIGLVSGGLQLLLTSPTAPPYDQGYQYAGIMEQYLQNQQNQGPKVACFAANTPILTLEGPRYIQDLKVGDKILSRSESDVDGPVEAKEVQEVFVTEGRIFSLHVGGQVIRTTAEHPFWVKDRGWTDACKIKVNDCVVSHDGQWVAVTAVIDTGEREAVYNVRIADFHTYFVGCQEWGFSVWAHNQCAYRAMSAQEFALASQGIWTNSSTTDNAGEKWFWDSTDAANGWRRWLRNEAAPFGAAARQDAHLSSQIIAAVNFDDPLTTVASGVFPHTLPGVPGGSAPAYSIGCGYFSTSSQCPGG